ncbi:unnamed protein product [Bursaphelenchus xylophilus]|uniref:Flavin-containing monooxygenase n=1 Tax=Bursaphelenchus xylophilus TaxID=6326 RepID=A0A1I7SAL4_BURXY|nr:unnamed protein product [Bursaphelenchus xylophilus]CAG9079227.1 unnamed protein product [Bursaphelenchus xylophilus]
MPVVIERKRCAIIGAGVSGLPSARWAKAYGYEPVIFELRDNVGGLWYYQEQETEFSCVMKKTIMNTSKEMSAYSDFPPPADTPWFMTNKRMHQYLQDYAHHHDLIKHCRFNHRVIRVERAPDFEESGEWIVEYEDGNENRNVEVFQTVLICTGRQSIPFMPREYPGQRNFKGNIIHSKQFKDASKFANKRVLIVGLGNSGTDAASEVGQVAKKCFLSTRRGAWILHRTINGTPNDFFSNRRIMDYMKRTLGREFHAFVMERVFRNCFDQRIFGLKPEHRAYNQNPILICDELQLRLAAGQVALKPAIKSFSGNSVQFADGSSEQIDEVVMATGFSYSFDYLESGKIIPTKDDELGLYKNMFPLSLMDSKKGTTLAVIGMLQLSGAIMCAMEMQSRVFFEVNAGNIRLPSKDTMTAEVERNRSLRRELYLNARASYTKVSYLDYMREMGQLIGCYASPFKTLFSDPYLAYRLGHMHGQKQGK